MTPESQRTAIAEACGWNITNGFLAKGDTPFVYVGEIATTWSDLDRHDISVIPDYLNDLNAMHEAEKVLLQRQKSAGSNMGTYDYGCWTRYVDYLKNCESWGADVHATAAQRAEAFLRTLGLWKDDK